MGEGFPGEVSSSSLKAFSLFLVMSRWEAETFCLHELSS